MLRFFGLLLALLLPLHIAAISSAGSSLKERFQDHQRNQQVLEQELREEKGDPVPLWMKLGRLMMAQNCHTEAQEYFEKARERRPNHLGALYNLGICHREIGTFQAFFMRSNQWDRAESYFRRVLEADSTFEDTYLQLAILERYRKNYTGSLDLALRAHRIKPRRISVNLGLDALFRSFLLHVGDEDAKIWLEQQRVPQALFYQAERLRGRGDFIGADSIYLQLLARNTLSSDVPIYLAQVRSYIQRHNPQAAEDLYWHAVDALRDSLDARIHFEDLKATCTDDEIVQFINISAAVEWHNFFKTFWLKRDPMPASPDNRRLIEHFRRMIYAEQNFRYDGFRTWNANPDQQEFLQFPRSFYLNQEFNDKGLIYIRHGEPDDKATALGAALVHNESWQYKERDGFPQMIFHFEIDEDGLAGDWRLTPMLRDSSAIDALMLWDAAYARYLRGDMTIRNRVANEIAHVSRDRVSMAMASDRHSWREDVEPLPVDFSVANFFHDEHLNLCEVSLCFPLAEQPAQVDIGVSAFDMRWRERAKEQRIVNVTAENPQLVGNEYIVTFRLVLPSGPHYLAFHIDPLDSPELGGSKLRLTLPDFTGDRLICSDLQLAHRIDLRDSSKDLSKENMIFTANPSGRVSRTAPLTAYIEIYHLSKDERGRTHYNVKTTLEDIAGEKRKGFLGLFGGGKSTVISSASDRSGFSNRETEVLRLDLLKTEPGQKRLSVEVTDLLNGARDRAQIECQLY